MANEINVFDQVRDLLTFESSDDFYYLQILQRKKENPQLGSNSRVIKNYYIGSIDYLENRYEEIQELCRLFNARAMIRLNKRSYRKVAFKTMQNLANSMSNDEYTFTKKSYDRACGNGNNSKDKTWIVDIDGEFDHRFLSDLCEYINETQPEGNKVLRTLPTKNGIHLITRPFNLQKFKQDWPDIDVHKDNPINLYIPSSL